MTVFQPTHQLIGPAGEEIPVMLVPDAKHMSYLAIGAIEYYEQTEPVYSWSPDRGVTYNGFKLEGLEIVPLNASRKNQVPLNVYETERAALTNQLMVL